jgi:hypothetical protein
MTHMTLARSFVQGESMSAAPTGRDCDFKRLPVLTPSLRHRSSRQVVMPGVSRRHPSFAARPDLPVQPRICDLGAGHADENDISFLDRARQWRSQ